MTPADPSTVDPALYGAVAIISICLSVYWIIESIVAAWRRSRRERLSRKLRAMYETAERDSKKN